MKYNRLKYVLLGLCAIVMGPITATAQVSPSAVTAEIDFPAYIKLSEEVQKYREDRLVSKNTFFAMADEDNTVILDTRSREAFNLGHIDGAINVNFSDFTTAKLAKIFANKDVRILIYCNNNFTNNEPPFEKKAIELALNLPTFINLYGYGYKNIYELKDGVDMDDPDMRIVRTLNALTQQ